MLDPKLVVNNNKDKKAINDLSLKFTEKLQFGTILPKMSGVSETLEADIWKCATVIHEKLLQFSNDLPVEELLETKSFYAAMVLNYTNQLSEILPQLPKKNNKAKAKVSEHMRQIEIDLRHINQYMMFLLPYGLNKTDFICELMPLLAEVDPILDKAIALKALSSHEKDAKIEIICRLYKLIYNSKSNENRHAMEKAYYWLDALSNPFSEQATELKLSLYSKQIRLDIQDGLLPYADSMLTHSITLIKKLNIKNSDDAINCHHLAKAYAKANNYSKAYYWLNQYNIRHVVKFNNYFLENAHYPLASLVLNEYIAKPCLEKERIEIQATLKQYREAHLVIIETWLKTKHPDESFKWLKQPEQDVLRLPCEFLLPEEALKRIKIKMAQSKMVISFNSNDAEKKHLYLYPLINISPQEISLLIKVRDWVKNQLIIQEKNRAAQKEMQAKVVDKQPTVPALKVSRMLPIADSSQEEYPHLTKKAKTKKSNDMPVAKEMSAPVSVEVSEALVFDQTYLNNASLYQCRLRGYGETPFYVCYVGEEKKSSFPREIKEQLINTLFNNTAKIVPEHESGFHRIKDGEGGVLVGKTKATAVRIIPKAIQCSASGVLYMYGNFVDYHAGSDRKNLLKRVKEIPRFKIGPK